MTARGKALRALGCALVLVALLTSWGGSPTAALEPDTTAGSAVDAPAAATYEDVVAVASYNGEPVQAATLYIPWLDLDSTLFIQNTADSPASVVLDLYESVGGGSYTESDTIPAHGSLALALETLSYLPPGFQGSAVLDSSEPVAAVVNVQPSVGGLLSYKCWTGGASQVILPGILEGYGYSTDIWIQNVGSALADVEMTFFHDFGGVYAYADSGINVGRSRVYHMADIPGLPSPFMGWVQVTASEPVAVVSGSQNSAYRNAMASSGIALPEAPPTLASPRQQKDASSTLIANPTATTAEVLANWYTLAGVSTWSESASVPSLASYPFNTGYLSLPSGFDGSLVLDSSQPVVGLVAWSGPEVGAAGFAASPAIELSDLTTVSHQPRVAHSASLGISTELSIQNPGSAPVNVSVTFYTPSGATPLVVNTTIEANGARRYATGDLTTLGEEWQGAATITSTGPIAVEVMQFLHSLVGQYQVCLPIVMRRWPPIPYQPTMNPISNPDGDGNYTVSWSAGDLATTYELQEDGTVVYSGPLTSWDATDKQAGTYCYRVRGCNSYGCGGWSNEQCVTVEPSTPEPQLWVGSNGFRFWVTPDWQYVEDPMVVVFTGSAMCFIRHFETIPIVNGHFEFNGGDFYGNGTFSSTTSCSGTFTLVDYDTGLCGILDGTWPYTAGPD